MPDPADHPDLPLSTRATLLLTAVLLLAAIALSVAASHWERFAGDLALTHRIQDAPQPAGALSELIRAVTSTELVIGVGLGIAALVAIVASRRQGLALALLFLLLPLVQSSVKDGVDRPRPPADLVDIRGSATSESFPSGHVMSGVVLFATLALVAWRSPLPRPARLAALVLLGMLALLDGFANVYEGVHWPSDVLGGYLWAAALLLAWYSCARALARRLP